MTKDDFIGELKKFHTHHSNRLRIIEHAIKGLVKNNSVCVSLYDCPIHQWLEKREKLLYKIYGSESIKELSARHEEWHEESGKICEFAAMKSENKKGFLGKVFAKKNRKLSEGEYDIAMAYLSNLKELTASIDSTFVRMTKRATALQSEMFEEVE
ncbi:MAG: hypothetical protein U9O83_07890 [Campylobacterota bacterium]|nr:hypothetical protein [Campylobacterota bacterium]